MVEEGRDPQDGSLQLFQVEIEVIPVLNGQQVVVVLLQDTRIKGCQIGLPAYIRVVQICGGKVTAEHKIGLVNFWSTLAACQDATVAHHGTHVEMSVENRRGVWEQRFEVVADGEDILVAGVVKVHQLAQAHAVLYEGEVVGNVNVVEYIFPGKETLLKATIIDVPLYLWVYVSLLVVYFFYHSWG